VRGRDRVQEKWPSDIAADSVRRIAQSREMGVTFDKLDPFPTVFVLLEYESGSRTDGGRDGREPIERGYPATVQTTTALAGTLLP
jgi:hypothetical protein